MTLIAARRYCHGKITEQNLALSGEPVTSLPPGTFDWIGLCEPDAAEMQLVQRQYGLHPLAVEDALNPRQLPKVEVYGQTLFVVARTAELSGEEEIAYGQTAIFVGPDYLVSVRFGSTRAHVDLRSQIEKQEDRLSEGQDYVLHAVLDFIVDGYLPLLDQLDEAAQHMEESAIDVFPEQAVIRRIFRLRRQLRKFERIVGPMEEMVRAAGHRRPALH